MALPAFTIHSAVRYSANAFAKAKSPRVRAWGPTVTGLAVSQRVMTSGTQVNGGAAG